MKNKMKTRTLNILLIMLIATYASAQEYHAGVKAYSYFGIGFYNDDDGGNIYFTLEGGELHKGDTVEFASGDNGVNIYHSVVQEDTPLSTARIDIVITEEQMKAITKKGISYVQVNDEVFFLKRTSVRKTKKMAKAAFR